MPLLACLMALFAVSTWGLNFVIIKSAVTEMSALGFLCLRFFATAIIFLPFIRAVSRKTLLDLLIIGILVGLCHQGFMFAGLQYTPAGTMAVLLQTQVLMSSLIGWIFLKETMSFRIWAGLGLGLVGVVVLLGGIDLSSGLMGPLFGLLSAFFLALAFIRMKQLKSIHPASFIALFNITALPFIFAMTVGLEGVDWIWALPENDWRILGPALAFQVFVLAFSQILWQRLLATYPVSKVMAWFLLIPVFGVLAGSILLEEAITLSVVIGGLTTIAGVALVAVLGRTR